MQVHKIRLIDNTYDIEIADQLLKKFIEAKVAFIEDRMNETDPKNLEEIDQLKLRLKDLEAETRSLDLFFEDHDGEDIEVEMGSTIVMSIKSAEAN